MQQLERENAELRARIGKVADTQQAVMKDAQERGILTLEPREGTTTPEFFDLQKYAAQGDYPGSIRLPGTNVSLQVGGFVQLDMLYDFDRIGSRDSFIPRQIPVDNPGAGETNFSARQTRLFLKTSAPTERGQLVTYVETDFFGSDNNAELRLRHAYGELGNDRKLLAGQTWSAFVDAPAFPSMLDQQGPAGQMLTRRPQLRYTQPLSDDKYTWAASLEDPNPDFANTSGIEGEGVARFPALVSNVRWKQDWGHLQVAGLLRQLSFDPDIGSRDDVLGWGVNFTGVFKTVDRNRIMFQIAGGDAIADYMNDTSGASLDGFYDGTELVGLFTFGGVLGYQHWWDRKWDSYFVYSYASVENESGQSPDAYHSGHYGAVNLRYHPSERVWLGGELLYGAREDNDGDTGEAVRLQLSARFNF